MGHALVKFRLPLFCLAMVTVTCFLGCQGTEDNQYTDKAPPTSDNAQPVTPPPNKVRMGGDGAVSPGPGASAGPGQPLAKPGGM
jgi:hypothetical protein